MFKLLISNSKIDLNKNKVVFNDYDKKLKIKIPLLTFAVAKKQYNIVQYLLSKSEIDINEKTETINEPTKYGETCLKISRNQSLTICNLSLQRPSIKIDSKSNEEKKSNYIEKTALHIAVESENLEMINLLLSKNEINVNDKSIEKRESNHIEKTALHIAIEKENFKIINSLLSNKEIDINIKSIEIINSVFVEKTTMQIAAEKRNSEIIKLLLNHDKINENAKSNEYLDTEIKLTKEKTAFNTTTDNNNQNIISLL